jgi:hypothetical protein
MSRQFQSMVRFLADDVAVSNGEVHDALAELDEEFAHRSATRQPILIERYRLRKVLRAVALERGLPADISGSAPS